MEDRDAGFGSTPSDDFVHYLDDGFRLPVFGGEKEILGLHSVAWYVEGEGSLESLSIDEGWRVTVPTEA